MTAFHRKLSLFWAHFFLHLTKLSLPNVSLQKCHFYELTQLSLPNFHYQICHYQICRYLICHYKIFITKFVIPNLSLPNLSLPNCHKQKSIHHQPAKIWYGFLRIHPLPFIYFRYRFRFIISLDVSLNQLYVNIQF